MPRLTRLVTALLLATSLLSIAQAAQTAEVSACTDFDAYANGKWVAATELPPDRARIGSFDALRVANDRVLEAGLVQLAANPARQTTPGLKLLAAQYRAGMDSAAIEKRGLSSLQPWLTRIASVQRDTLPALIGEMARLQIAAPLAVFVSPDAKDATRNALQLSQAGLGLPDRDDYFGTDDNSRKLQAAYRVYAERLLKAAGTPADAATLDALMAFEKDLAQASVTRVQRRDPNAQYNLMTPASLMLQAPGFDWAAWLAAYASLDQTAATTQRLIVGQPGFAAGLAAGRQGAAGHLAHLPACARARSRGRVRPASRGAGPFRLPAGRHPRPEGSATAGGAGHPDDRWPHRRFTTGRNAGRIVRRQGVFAAGTTA